MTSSADFVLLGPRTSLYVPEKPIEGQLVILFTWLGASPKHIAKYIAAYQRIAPGAYILLIESPVSILISSYTQQRAAMLPAVSAVLKTLVGRSPLPHSEEKRIEEQQASRNLSLPNTTPRILLHMFSNGGANSATQFLLAVQERLREPLPLVGMLYDSCPTKGTYWRDHRAMAYSFPKAALAQAFGNIAVHIILLLQHTETAFGLEDPVSLLRRTLIDGDKISGVHRSCYLYSETDQVVAWTDIRDHAAEARREGWQVEEVMFDGSGHCAHILTDEDRYIAAVERIWHGAVDQLQTGKPPSKL
ncbi:MAG: hypothetical protein HETSPECPRED_004150 [Heterodermia speciosa]|uniref:Indole-diterpene biosynthesis protein PaxU n=1 Tax=Heterodermia speciosa TaxID=116794 RepID=A0A8H3FAJ6_9LECA|nr:MAG: hypothetical protein HETSPECPRED_004150 [Heterodermia speciosa]